MNNSCRSRNNLDICTSNSYKHMTMTTKKQAKKTKITQGEYVDRLRVAQGALVGLNYKTLYEYEYEKLNETDSIRLTNFWHFRCNDAEFLERFEQIASNIKNS